jgi:hypothetical protein
MREKSDKSNMGALILKKEGVNVPAKGRKSPNLPPRHVLTSRGMGLS